MGMNNECIGIGEWVYWNEGMGNGCIGMGERVYWNGRMGVLE